MFSSLFKRFKGLITVFILLINVPLVFSQTTSGVLSKDESWSGVVKLTGDVTIPEDITLTILPGTEVRFAAKQDDTAGGTHSTKSELIVKGSLIAKGSAAEKVKFSSDALIKARGDWGGINVQYTHGVSSFELDHCIIEYAETGFSWTIQSGLHTTSISNTEVKFSNANGIYIHANAGSKPELTLTANKIHNNTAHGIYIFSKGDGSFINATIKDSEIYSNDSMGIYSNNDGNGKSTLSVLNNTVRNNQSYGIHFNSSWNTTRNSQYTVKGNTVHDNKDIGIYTYSTNTTVDGVIEGNTVYGNSHGIHVKSYYGYTHSAVIRGNTVRDNRNNGVNIYAETQYPVLKVTVTGNEIYNNKEHGLILHKNNYRAGHIYPTITLNNIYKNGKTGIYCRGSGVVNILYNSIINNSGDGLYLEGGNGSNVNYNNLVDNKGVYTVKNGTGNAVNGRYNFWSKSILDEIAGGVNPQNITAIYDSYDESAKGTVDYSSHLAASISIPTNMESSIISPADGGRMKTSTLTIKGVAVAKSGVSKVEISSDNGATWQAATGKESWSYEWPVPADGAYSFMSRVTDLNNQTLVSPKKVSVTIDSTLPTTSGSLSGNESWSGEVLITGDVTVPSGVKLTIQAGTVVKFQALNDDRFSGSNSSRCELIVKGSLVVEGTAASKVQLISSSANPAVGDWYGVRVVTEESNEQVSFKHMVLKDSSLGVDMRAKSFSLNSSFDSCSISGTGGHGIYFQPNSSSSSTLQVLNSTLSSNAQSGIFVDNFSKAKLTVDLQGNTVDSNKVYGIYLYSRDDGSVIDGAVKTSEIHSNTNIGLYINNGSNGKSTLSLLNNTVRNNQNHGIHFNSNWNTTRNSKYTIKGNTVHDNKDSGIYTYSTNTTVDGVIEGNTVYGNSNGIHVKDYYGYTHSAVIRGNTVRDNRNNGVNIYAESQYPVLKVTVTGNEIYNNKEHGLILHKNNYRAGHIYPTITLNNIYKNGQNGIYCRGSGVVNMLYNDLRDNTGDGIYLEGGTGSNVNYNNIVGNKGAYALKNGTGNAVNGRYNFWSKSILDEIALGGNPKNITAIYDIYDEAAKGNVDYTSELLTAVTLPAAMESSIISPADGAKMKAATLTIKGVAVARAGVSKVEISSDNGATWQAATGKESWSYEWPVPADGLYSFMSRVTDLNNQTLVSPKKVSVTIDSTLPTTSGSLSGNESWSGEVLITGDVTVPSGVKLTIQAGTVVKFLALNDDRSSGSNTSRCELIVKGSLVVEGTAASKVQLISSSANPAVGDWYGVRVVTEESNEQVSFKHMVLKDSSLGVNMRAKSFSLNSSFDSCSISGTGGHGIYFQPNTSSSSTLQVLNSTLSNNAQSGIFVDNFSKAKLTVDLQGNTVDSNKVYGIYLYSKDDGSVIDGAVKTSEIHSNTNIGLYINNGSNGKSTLSLLNNTVRNNQNHGIHFNSNWNTTRNSQYTVKGNTVHDNKNIGIYTNSTHTTVDGVIEGNRVYGNSHGIHVKSHYSYTHSAVIRGNTVRDNRNNGVNIYAESQNPVLKVTVTGNEIYNNKEHGLILHKNNYRAGHIYPTITLNNIYKNGQNGIYCRGSGVVNMLYNELRDNTGDGIYLEGGTGSSVNYNNIVGNKGAYALKNGTGNAVNGRYNFWSKSILDEIALGGNPKNITAIYDIYDEAAKGNVDYTSELAAAVTLPTSMESNITSPADGGRLKAATLTIKGVAVARAGVSKVEISSDNGATWQVATGKESWSYEWPVPADGLYSFMSRVTDLNNQTLVSPKKVSVTIDSTLPTTSGSLSGNESWAGEVLITGDVTVPSGVKLTIQAGTVVKFLALNDDRSSGSNSSRCELIVKGSLVVEGTAASKVQFISSSANPAVGDWYGVRVVTEESNEQVSFKHMVLKDSSLGVDMRAKSFSLNSSFDSCSISGTGGHGIYFQPNTSSSSTLQVLNSTLSNNAQSGIFVDNFSKAKLTVDLQGNTVDSNKVYGIYLYSRDDGSVIDGAVKTSEIHSNSNIGLYINNGSNGKSTLSVLNNTVRNNQNHGIHFNSNWNTTRNSQYTVKGNTVHDNKDIGIYTNSTHTTVDGVIEGNRVYGNSHGIHVKSHYSYTHSAVIRGNTVRDNRNNGVNIYAESQNPVLKVTVTGNEIYNNKEHGLILHKNNYRAGHIYPTITLNNIYKNGQNGIYCRGSGVVNMLYNELRDNTGDGIYLEGGTGSSVNYNNIVGNKGAYALKNGTGSAVNGRYNFWSKSILDEIALGSNPKNITAIYDIYDEAAKGTVDYSYSSNQAVAVPAELASNIITPENNSILKTTSLKIKGIAAARRGINRVEISPDNGTNWYPATGKESWSYDWTVPADGVYTLMARVIDNRDNIEANYNRITVTIDSRQATTSGTLTADESWAGEVLITGDVTVPENVKLTIEPGTVVKFAALQDDRAGGVNTTRSELIVKGELSAVGTSLKPITFTSASANAAKGDWYGIRVLTETKASSIQLENYRIAFCHNAFDMRVKGQQSSLTMVDGKISETVSHAIRLEGSAKAKATINLTGNSILNSGGYGIYSLTKNRDSSLTGAIKYSNIKTTANNGICLHNDDYSSSNMEVIGNILTKNGTHGIYAYSSNHSNAEVRIIGNKVSVTKDGIYVNDHYSTVYAEVSDNEVSNNLGIGISLYTNHSSTMYSQILRNTVYKNSGNGIQIDRVNRADSKNYPLIAFNTIYANKGSGISSFATTKVKLNYNNIYTNTAHAVYNNSTYVIEANNNWWGERITKEMNVGSGFDNISALYDHLDNSAKGKIDYRNWLPAASDNSGERISKILKPTDGAALAEGKLTVEGIAFAREQIGQVELSYDNGTTWHPVISTTGYKGKGLWSFQIEELLKGTYKLQTRVVDKKGVLQSPVNEITVTVGKDVVTTAGLIERDQTWSGVVRLTGDVTVPAGVTLTVMPGTVVEMPALADSTYSGANSSKSELIINGTLLAAGSVAEPVTFTSYSSNAKKKGDWVGIRGQGQVNLENAKVEYGETGVNLRDGATLLMKSSTISNSSGTGLYFDLRADRTTDLTVEQNSFLNNGANGFHLYTRDNSVATLTLKGNSFSGNGDNAVYCYADGNHGNPTLKATVTGNTIDKTKNRGVYFYTVHGAKSELAINNNEIHHSGVGIYSQYYYSGTSTLSIDKNSVYSGTKGIEVYSDYATLSPVITNNTLYNNSQDAIRALNHRTSSHIFLPQLEGNHCYDNTGNGIYVKPTAAITLSNNSIYGNAGHDLYNDSAFAVNAQNNWWGIATTNELAKATALTNISAIFDKLDNSAKGPVDYSLWQELFVIPAIPVLEAVVSPTKSATQLLKGTKEAGVGIVINGQLLVPVDNLTTWSYSYNLSEGENILKIYAENSAGMTSESIETVVTLDTKAPTLFSSSPAADSMVRQKVEKIVINLQEDSSEIDAAATISSAQVTDSSGNPVNGSWTSRFYQFTFTAAASLSDGSYTVTMAPLDKPLANKGAITIKFSVDRQIPVASVVEPVVSPTNVNKQIVKGTKEAGTAVWLNDKEIVAQDSKLSWQYELTLSEGETAYTLYLKDEAGNRSPESSFSITLDTKAPQLLSSVPANNGFVSGSISELRVAYLEETTEIDSTTTIPTLSVKNSKGQNIAGQWTVVNRRNLLFKATQPLWEEKYSVALKTFDLAGNSKSDSLTFTVDSTAPDAPTLNPVESPTRLSIQTLTGNKDVGSSVWVNGKEASAVNTATTWSYDISLLEGVNPVEVHSRDRAGNRSVSVNSTITYDDVAPLPVTTLKAEGKGSGTVVSLDWTGYDESKQGDLTSYNIYSSTGLITQLTGLTPIGSVPAGTFTYRAEGLTKGIKLYFAVVAVDSKGNSLKSVTPVTATPQDVEAPEDIKNIRVNCYDNKLIFNWDHSANSAGDLVGYKLFLNGTTAPILVAKESNKYEESGLSSASSYPVKIVAYDGEGNESAGVSGVGVTLMNNPVGLKTDPQNGYIELSWTPAAKSELVKHYNVYLSDGQFHNVAAMQPRASVKGDRFKLSGLKNGITYFIAVTTVNLSGGEKKNVVTVFDSPVPDMVGPQVVSVKWNDKLLNSSLTLVKPGDIRVNAIDPMGVGRVEFRVDGNFMEMDSKGADGYSYNWNIYNETDGTHDVVVVAYDSIGNSTSWSSVVNVKLAAPAVPQLTKPAANYITNRPTVNIEGTADPYSKITLFKGGVDTGLTTTTDSKGLFQAQINLDEGENSITATATNRAGSSAKSVALKVTFDNTLPDAPTGVIAEAGENGTVKLGWSNGTVANLQGFNIYRAKASFTEIAQAEKLNTKPVQGNIYKDLPAADGLYFYRFTSIDGAGNESLLSRECSVTSDSTMPEAVSITYSPEGLYDAATNRFAPGKVGVNLKVSEKLMFTPYLTIVSQGRTVTVDLVEGKELEYTGSFTITKDLAAGTAHALFSARDLVGNRGTTIKSGGTIEIDTAGPELAKIELIPGYPVKTSQAEPVQIRAIFSLTEEVKTGAMPTLSYLLSGAGRTNVALTNLRRVPATGFAEGWEALFTLPADAALSGVEMLSFKYSGEDDLANVSTKIKGLNSFEIYRNSLPNLAAPLNLQAAPLGEGKIKLTWNSVEGAFDYQLFRKGAGETVYSELKRSAGQTEFIDSPAAEGSYSYVVATVRSANGEESLSEKSNSAAAISDSTAPGAPTTLKAELVGNGIKLDWQAAPYTEAISYRIYRIAGSEITSTAGLTPLVEDIKQTMVVDPTPSATEGCYAVTAVDAVGNESPLSNSVYLNFKLLPVANIKVRKVEDAAPVISWSHSGANINGFDIYLDTAKGKIKLNEQRLRARSFSDAGHTIDERQYTINAVDNNGFESPGRRVLLPKISAELKAGQQIKRGIMNRVSYLVENSSNEPLDKVRLLVKVGGKTHSSDYFSLASRGSAEIPVRVGGYNNLPDLADITTTIEIVYPTAEQVELVRGAKIGVTTGMLSLSIRNEEFTRGVTGKVRFTLDNTSSEEIEIVTATGLGQRGSNEIFVNLLDLDGNMLSTAPFKQASGNSIVTLSNGLTVARIAPNAGFSSGPVEIDVPFNAPEKLRIQLEVRKIHFHTGRVDHVVMEGINSSREITLIETAYYGEITSVVPADSYGKEPIVIKGRALQRGTASPMAHVALDLVVRVNGFERVFKMFTKEDGTFNYQYSPTYGEAGVYRVGAVHPDLKDRPEQAKFVIRAVDFNQGKINLTIPKNYRQKLSLRAKPFNGTDLKNLRVLYRAEDQPGGILAKGVHLELPALVSELKGRQSSDLNMTIWADSSAASTGKIVLKVASDEVAGEYIWHTMEINANFMEAKPVLQAHPTFIETGVSFNGNVTEQIVLENKGLAMLEDVRVKLLTDRGAAAPAWAYLTSPAKQGNLKVGEKKGININFSPDRFVAEGVYSFNLEVTAANTPSQLIPIYVNVITSDKGNVLFKLANIYTAYKDKNGKINEGLEGAKIRIQNEKLLSIEFNGVSDAKGELMLRDLPAGRYKYRITANKHEDKVGTLWIKAGITVTEDLFMSYNLISVEWEVTETTIKDKYEILLTATYETDVPAAVVVCEPSSITLPDMEVGDVFYSELKFTNYGLITAEDVGYNLPADDQYYKYEMLGKVPSTIPGKESVTVPFRVTALSRPENDSSGASGGDSGGSGSGGSGSGGSGSGGSGSGGSGSGGSGSGGPAECFRYTACGKLWYRYKCSNGMIFEGTETKYCLTKVFGEDCNGSSGGGWWWGGGSGSSTVNYTGPTNTTSPKATPKYKPIDGVTCDPKIYCEVDDECCKAKAREKVKSSVDLLNGEYSDDVEDISVEISGMNISVKRYYYDNRWHFPEAVQNIEVVYGVDKTKPELINRGGVSYEKSNEQGTVFSAGGDDYIFIKGQSYRWEDVVSGQWRDYDKDGKLLSYGDRYNRVVNILYTANRLSGMADGSGIQHVWYDYHADGNIKSIRDAAGRNVTYEFTNSRLTKVKDLLGNFTEYGYDTEGKMVSKTDINGKVVNIEYNQFGYVNKFIYSDGAFKTFDYNFDSVKGVYYTQVAYSSGKVIERWYDRGGLKIRTDINGVMQEKVIDEGRKKTTINALGAQTIEEYDEWGNLIRATAPNGAVATYKYDTKTFNLLEERLANGNVKKYSYYTDGNVKRLVEGAEGTTQKVTDFTYDDRGNILTTKRLGDINTQESTITITYNDNDDILTYKDAKGDITNYDYNLDGQLEMITDPENNTITYTYYPVTGRVKTVTDGDGNRNLFEYDISGNVKRFTDAADRVTLYDYDANNRVIKVTDPSGRTMEYKYNLEDRVTERTLNGRYTERTFYNADGKIIKAVDMNGNEVTADYDNLGRAIKETNSRGQSTTIEYSSAGRVSKINYPDVSQSFEYDKIGQVAKIIKERGTQKVSETYKYNVNSRPIEITDNEGLTVKLEYDQFDKMTSRKDKNGALHQYAYDNRGNLIKYTDPAKNVTTFEYDLNNRVVKKVYPDKTVKETLYYKNGRIAKVIDGKNQMISYEYNSTGKVLKQYYYNHKSELTPVKTVSFTYDKLGRMATWSDGTFSRTNSYNDLLRTYTVSMNYGTFSKDVTYSYDDLGRIGSFTGTDSTVYDYHYNSSGKLDSIILPGEGAISFEGYKDDAVGKIIFPGGISQNLSYDSSLQLIKNEVLDIGGKALMSEEYVRDYEGQIEEKRADDGSYKYIYDAANQLKSVKAPGAAEESFVYDAMGNRNTLAGSWNYNNLNQLKSTADTTFTYDLNGNMESRANATDEYRYSYDIDNRLVKVAKKDGTIVAEYSYGVLGNRLKKVAGGVTTYYFHTMEGLVAEFNELGEEQRSYGYSPETKYGTSPLFMKEGGKYFYYLNDYKGAPIKMVNKTGVVVWSAKYDGWGRALVSVDSIVTNSFRGSSQYYDSETGLHYNRFRYYDADLGRYINRDPMEEAGGENLYLFAANDPVNKVDPLGLKWLKTNCNDYNLGFKLGATVGIGGEVSLGLKISVCDCCDEDTNEFRSSDYISGELSITLEFKVGVGVSFELAIVKFELEFNLLTFSVSSSVSVAKKCGDEGYEIKLTLLKIEAKTMDGSASATVLGVGLTLSYSVTYSAEAYVTIDVKSSSITATIGAAFGGTYGGKYKVGISPDSIKTESGNTISSGLSSEDVLPYLPSGTFGTFGDNLKKSKTFNF